MFLLRDATFFSCICQAEESPLVLRRLALCLHVAMNKILLPHLTTVWLAAGMSDQCSDRLRTFGLFALL